MNQYNDIVLTDRAMAGTDTPLMARIDKPSTGVLIVRADVQSITCKCALWETPTVLTLNVTVPTTAVLVSGTSTVGWRQDGTGYNTRHVLPASAIPVGGVYAIKYTLTYTDGTVQVVLWRLEVQGCPIA